MFFLKLNTMKKNILWMMTAILFCGLSLFLTSCGDDDDKPQPADKSQVSCTVTIKLNAEVVSGLPVKVGYYDADGSIKQEVLTANSWEKTITYDLNKTHNVGCVAARMIDGEATFVDDEWYNISMELNIPANMKYSDGSNKDFQLSIGGGFANRMKGEGIKRLMERDRNYIGYNHATYKMDPSTFATADAKPIMDAMGLKN